MVYYSKSHFSAEPVITNHDPYSVSLTFLPTFSGAVKPFIETQKGGLVPLAPTKSSAFNPLNISFGPLDKQNGDTVVLLLFQGCDKIFRLKTKVYDPKIMDDSSLPFVWTTYIASCFRQPSDYSSNPIDLGAYRKFAQQYQAEPSDMVISLGDTVYLQRSQVGSRYGVLKRYNNLLNCPFLKESFTNSWWIAGIDDHDLGLDDTLGASYNIEMIRTVQKEVFPRVAYALPNTLNSLYSIGDITIVVLDDVSHRKYDIKKQNYSSILGEAQLEWFFQALVNTQLAFGPDPIIMVVEGKSWFGSYGGMTYTTCPSERERILNTIDGLGLTNVYHLCGDSHFSDQSYYPLNSGGITEFRNSAIGSFPRKNIDDNPYRVPGSLVDVNNFGKIKISKVLGKYTLDYKVFTKEGMVYEWTKPQVPRS